MSERTSTEAPTKQFDISRFNIPDVFITDASIAKHVVDQAVQSHHRYWEAIEAMEKHLKGAKPIPPEELRKQSLSWVSNWNFGKGSSKLEQIVAESVGLVRTALAILSPSFRRFKPDSDAEHVLLIHLDDDNTRRVFANKIARVFADTLEKDSRWPSFLNLLEYCSTAFGYSSVTHDQYDWMGNANHTNSVAFEDHSKANDCRCWVVFDTIKADRLYRIWLREKKKEVAEVAEGEKGETTPVSHDGWHINGLEEALYHAFQGQLDFKEGEQKPSTWEDVLDYVSGKGWTVSAIRQNLENVSVAKIYRREMDGMISQTYVAYGNSFASPMVKKAGETNNSPAFSPDFLLFQKTRKEHVRDRLNLIRDSSLSNSGYIQDYRGIGRQLVENSTAYNRLRNGNETKLTLLGQPMFMRGSAANGQPFQLGVTQGFTLLDPNYTLPERQFQFDMRQHMEWMRFEEGEYQRETNHHDPKIQLSSRPNKSEVAAKQQEAAGPKQAKNALKLMDYSSLFGSMIRNLVMLRDKIKAGSPGKATLDYFYDELLYEFRDFLDPNKTEDENKKDIIDLLKALVSINIEPVVDDVDSLTRALQLVTDPIQVNRLERQLFMAMGFSRREIDALRPLITDKLDGGDDEWMAAVENDMFFTTGEVRWSKNQNPLTHLNAHFAKADRVIQNVAQGEDPIKAITFIQNVLRHCQQHMKHMAEHPFFSRYFPRYAEAFKRLVKIVPKLEEVAKQILEQQQAAQQGGQPSAEQQAAMMKAQADIQIKEFQALKKEERTDYLTQVRLRQNQATTEQKERIKEQEHQAKLERQAEMGDLKKQLTMVESALTALTENNG